jgi:hypothetical protein
VKGLHLRQIVQAVGLAPQGEPSRGVQVGFARVVVVDLRGENSSTRFAPFGVGANSRAGSTTAAAGETMS